MSNESPKLVRTATRAELPITGPVIVGRQAGCTLTITEGQLSRRHARLVPESTGVFIEDLGSTNGTFVNNERISALTLLKHGDRVRFDSEEFEFVAPVVETEQKTLMRPVAPPPPPPKPAPAPTPAPAPPPPAAPRAPAAAVAAPAPTGADRPGAWVDPELSDGGANKTKFYNKGELLGELNKVPGQKQTSEVKVPTLILTESGQQIALTVDGSKKQEWTIGSDPGRQIVITGSGVSGLHARLIRENERWKLSEEMSSNGTFVNDQKILAVNLQSGDRIFFGPVGCVFRLPAAGVVPAAQPRPSAVSSAAPPPTNQKNKTVVIIGVLSFIVTLALLFIAYLFLQRT